MTRDQIRQLAEKFFRDTLHDIETDRAMGVGSVCPRNEEEREAYLEALDYSTAEMREALPYNDLKKVYHLVDDLLAQNSITLDRQGEPFAFLCREIIKQVIRVNEVEKRRMMGDYSDDIHLSAPSLPSPAQDAESFPKDDKSPLLSNMIDKFIEDYKRNGRANENSIKEYASSCKLLQDIVGDKSVTAITRDTLRGYHDTLKKLPPHINSRKAYRGKTIPQILQMDITETLSDSAISKHITIVKGLFSWLVREEAIEKNIADVLRLPPKKAPVDEQRKAFDAEDLKKMVSGYLEEDQKGNLKGRPERLWVPIISLFSGMRLNEVCQLHTDDVTQVDGVWCFMNIADEDGEKRLKTEASKRTVPIHPSLIEMGFLNHYQTVKDAGEPRLWMHLTKSTRGYHKNFSNWFLRDGFLRTYMTKDRKKTFHSFRHTFVNALKQLEVQEVIIAEIVGHENASITTGRYGKKFKPEKYLEKMLLIDYGVEFSPLREIASAIIDN